MARPGLGRKSRMQRGTWVGKRCIAVHEAPLCPNDELRLMSGSLVPARLESQPPRLSIRLSARESQQKISPQRSKSVSVQDRSISVTSDWKRVMIEGSRPPRPKWESRTDLTSARRSLGSEAQHTTAMDLVCTRGEDNGASRGIVESCVYADDLRIAWYDTPTKRTPITRSKSPRSDDAGT